MHLTKKATAVAVLAVAAAIAVGLYYAIATPTGALGPVGAPAANAPTYTECATFDNVYNAQVTPALSPTLDPQVGLAAISTAYAALAAVVSTQGDPYSQAIHSDIIAMAADPGSTTTLAAFQLELPTFLNQCDHATS